ncbi:dipeptidyl peptidase [Cryphonectria parasitica EP155]|uniref:Dipeptidyl-peptidase V n=1 Tax=Cryphonectria parasitica (strain ATCC 38755 / EP155) TaxID=660469 RepID=A0A9P4Y971_CRYP1|nr:dipeptidyl peptidase [Cryphonectria parasitica EP155]KAF3769284.1 dipeptidyl peptidase [Cryphonectria parasitica EP155]
MMTIRAAKFTPEVLLSAPRRSAGIPNNTGKLVLYTTSTYSFKEHKKTGQIHVLDVNSGQSTTLYSENTYSEPTWLSEKEFLFLKSGDKGASTLLLADVDSPGATPKEISKFPGAIANLKVKSLSDDTAALACSALVTPSGEIYNPETEKKPLSSAMVYTSLFARHWDSWVTENRNAVFYGSLRKTSRTWSLEKPGLVNALRDTGLQSPIPPFGGTGDFDIGPAGLVFVAPDPKLSPATHTKSDLYFVPLDSFTQARAPVPQLVRTGDLRGYTAAPAFSRSGRSVAFTRMRNDQYESDKPRLLLLPDIGDLANVQEFYATPDGEGGWDRRPDTMLWGPEDKELFVVAEDLGRSKVFRLPASPLAAGNALPKVVSDIEGSVSDVKALGPEGNLLVSASSLIDSSFYTVLDPSSGSHRFVSSNTRQGKTFGLSRAQVDELWFDGAGGYKVHAWVLRPSDFDPSRKYPIALLIHGGPQSAWADAWSTRWNPAVFAEQGYIAVMPNPTGSTGYGMSLQNGIRGDWGGRPYEDLVKCHKHIAETMADVADLDRSVALGASYGGFMINWMQGHELGRKFKALVCHDGVFSTLNQYSSEELFFPIHDFGGQLWENRAGYERWDPARFTDQWATPQLVIHNELDYRLPISEGLAAFNVLQSRGVPSKLLVFPDENHWVLKPENSLVWHREVLDWINKYSGVGGSTAGG